MNTDYDIIKEFGSFWILGKNEFLEDLKSLEIYYKKLNGILSLKSYISKETGRGIITVDLQVSWKAQNCN